MLVTNDEAPAGRARSLINQAKKNPDETLHKEVGYNDLIRKFSTYERVEAPWQGGALFSRGPRHEEDAEGDIRYLG